MLKHLKNKIDQLATEVVELKFDKHTKDVVEDTSTQIAESQEPQVSEHPAEDTLVSSLDKGIDSNYFKYFL